MTESILQTYLNEQHIKVADESSVENLKKAISQVKKHLTQKKAEIIPFTLVALDPKVKDIDPVVQHVEKIIIKTWSAFKNSVTATKDKSTTYVRAVILESLSHLTKGDTAIAALVWLTARDVIGHYHLSTEEGVVSRFLQALADQTEKNGQSSWGGKSNFQFIEFNGGKISAKASINEKHVAQHFKRAFGSSDGDTGGENPHLPVDLTGSYNNHRLRNNSDWGEFAADISAKGITEVVNSALSQQVDSIQKGLDTYFAHLQPFFEKLQTSIVSSITANNKRSELLWWKQSLYSRSLNTSYRSLDPLNSAVAMALDLAEQVDAIYPESVDYLLREILKEVHREQAEEERLLTDWLTDSRNLNKNILSALNEYAAGGDARKSLLSAWANVVQSGEAAEFFTETGVDKTAKLTVSDLAVWLFHGLQAHRLATAK